MQQLSQPKEWQDEICVQKKQSQECLHLAFYVPVITIFLHAEMVFSFG